METGFELTFANGHTAQGTEVQQFSDLAAHLRSLGLPTHQPTFVIVGGASGITDQDFALLQTLFESVFATLAESLNATVIDGGTNSGVMQLMGQARAKCQGTFPLIGVAPVGKVALPHETQGTQLEPNHTHFVLVPGNHWGDECSWMSQTATILAAGAPSLTVAINGGEITWQDVSHSVAQQRAVITLAGTGRTADQLAAAVRGEASDPRADELVASGLIQAIDLAAGMDAIAQVLKQLLCHCPT